MARLVATLASTHHPFYLKATTAPREQQIPQAAEWKRKVESYRDTLAVASPEVLVMVGSDHFHQLSLTTIQHFSSGTLNVTTQPSTMKSVSSGSQNMCLRGICRSHAICTKA